MFCSQCGKEIADSSKFCSECGKAVNPIDYDSIDKAKKVLGKEIKKHQILIMKIKNIKYIF